MIAQVGVIGGVLPGFVTGIHKDSVRRWNLWFPSAAVFAKVLAGRATGTQITSPPIIVIAGVDVESTDVISPHNVIYDLCISATFSITGFLSIAPLRRQPLKCGKYFVY